MDVDSLLQLMRARRSIRRFKPDAIPDEYVDKMLEAARWAPSGGNAQPWEFVVVKDRDTVKQILDIHHEYRVLSHKLELTRVKELRHPQVAGYPKTPFYRDAPVIIIVCGDLRTLQATVMAAHFLEGSQGVFHENLANATFAIHLTATALGLGTQWVTVSPYWEGKLKALLGIPEIFSIFQMVPVGYPYYHPKPSYRRELSEIVHYERYDQAKIRSDEDIWEYLAHLRKKVAAAYPESADGADGE